MLLLLVSLAIDGDGGDDDVEEEEDALATIDISAEILRSASSSPSSISKGRSSASVGGSLERSVRSALCMSPPGSLPPLS